MAEEGWVGRLLRILSIAWYFYKTFLLPVTPVLIAPVFYKVIIAPTELEDKPSILQDQTSTLEGRISALSESVKTLEDTVPALEERVAAIEEQVSKWGKTPGTTLGAQCQWKKSEIMPFKEGEHGLDSNELDVFVKTMSDGFKDHQTLQHLILIGRTDITPLKKGKREFYGSNNGLAQARAKWVLVELKKELKKKLPEWKGDIEKDALLLSAGPLHVGEANENDRSVEVWTCWVPKEPEQASASRKPAG